MRYLSLFATALLSIQAAANGCEDLITRGSFAVREIYRIEGVKPILGPAFTRTRTGGDYFAFVDSEGSVKIHGLNKGVKPVTTYPSLLNPERDRPINLAWHATGTGDVLYIYWVAYEVGPERESFIYRAEAPLSGGRARVSIVHLPSNGRVNRVLSFGPHHEFFVWTPSDGSAVQLIDLNRPQLKVDVPEQLDRASLAYSAEEQTLFLARPKGHWVEVLFYNSRDRSWEQLWEKQCQSPCQSVALIATRKRELWVAYTDIWDHLWTHSLRESAGKAVPVPNGAMAGLHLIESGSVFAVLDIGWPLSLPLLILDVSNRRLLEHTIPVEDILPENSVRFLQGHDRSIWMGYHSPRGVTFHSLLDGRLQAKITTRFPFKGSWFISDSPLFLGQVGAEGRPFLRVLELRNPL